MKFALTEEQELKAAHWMAEKKVKDQGAIGGQFTFEFTNTSIGQVQKVRDCVSNEVLDLTDYEMF